jgi:hypothetical protein
VHQVPDFQRRLVRQGGRVSGAQLAFRLPAQFLFVAGGRISFVHREKES